MSDVPDKTDWNQAQEAEIVKEPAKEPVKPQEQPAKDVSSTVQAETAVSLASIAVGTVMPELKALVKNFVVKDVFRITSKIVVFEVFSAALVNHWDPFFPIFGRIVFVIFISLF
jgi:ribosomal protein L16 Arg81 hydroxylase